MGRLERFEKIRTKQEKEYLGSEWGVGEDDVDFLIEEVERLRNTLKFYAKEETYEQHHHYYGNGNAETSEEPILVDKGLMARIELEDTK